MTLPPIYRLKQWFSSLGEGRPRPNGILQCAACRADVPSGEGIWSAQDGAVTCNEDCATEWLVDRSY